MILTVTNQKGGVGKTTTAQTLGAGLSLMGYKVLLIDSDPQTNLTYSAGFNPKDAHMNLFDVYEGKATIRQAALNNHRLDVVPGSEQLIAADKAYTQTGREYILQQALEPVKGSYQFIIIDTPPTLGILTINALTASDYVIIPFTASIYSLQGLGKLYETITAVKKFCNKSLAIDGLLLTRYRAQANISQEAADAAAAMADKIGTRLYKSVIREAVAVSESQSAQSDLFKTAPKANVTADYKNFIDEFLAGKEI